MAEQEDVPLREEFPRWYRPVGMGDNRERLESRWKGVLGLVKNADANSVETMIAIVLRTKPRPLAANVESLRETFKKFDDLFDMKDNDRELEILCGSALATLFETDSDAAVRAALAITTASCGGIRTADFPVDLMGAAEAAIARISEARRTRPDVGKMTIATPPKISGEGEYPAGADPVAALNALSKKTENAMLSVARNVNTVLKAAHHFAEIQDEELQMLWWLFGGRSTQMDCPFSEIPPAAQPFVLAAELAEITRFLPGPGSIKPILSRAGLKERTKSSVTAAVNACGSDLLRWLIGDVEPSKITQPLHFAIKRQLETGDDTSWVAAWSRITGIDAGFSLPGIELGNLFYRERLSVLFGGE